MRATAGFLKAMAIGVALLCIGASSTAAQDAGSAASPRGSAVVTGAARPIAAWVDFCQTYSGECNLNLAEPTRITWTPAVASTVAAVNRRVNRGLRAMTDQDHLGMPDRWDFAEDGIGDCEDFQLVKRRLLAQAGLPHRAMRMTVVIDEKGEGHAVLTLITDRGDIILDNKTNAVMAWHETGYTFIKRESQDSRSWVSLGGAVSPVVTANR